MFRPSPWLRMDLSLHMPFPRQLSTAVHPLANFSFRNARLPGRRFHSLMTGRLAAGFRSRPCICRRCATRGSESLGIVLKQHSRLAEVSLAVQFRVLPGHATGFRCHMSNAKQEEPSPGLGAKSLKFLEAKSSKSRIVKRPADVSSVDSQEGAAKAIGTSQKGVSSASTSTSKTSRSKANRKNLTKDTIALGTAKTAANGLREGVSAASSDATHQNSRVKKVKKVDQTYSSANDHVSNGSSLKSTPSIRHSDSSLEQVDTSQKSVKTLSTGTQSSSVVNTVTSRIRDSQQRVSKSSVSYATMSQSEHKPAARKTNFPSALDSTTRIYEQNIVSVDTNVSKLKEVSLDSLDGSVPNHVQKDYVAVQSSNSSMDQDGSRASKRVKQKSEGIQITWKINSCSKYADFHGAIEVYNKLKSEGKCSLLQQHAYNVLLYLCSGAASGTLTKGKSGNDEKNKETAKGSLDGPTAVVLEPSNNAKSGELKLETEGVTLDADVVHFSPKDMKLAAWKGVEIYEDMMNARIPANEATLTSVVRLATAKGDGDLAFEIIKRMAAEGIEPKLRSYSPPLLLFCKTGQAKKAYEVDDHMLASGVHPDEALLEALLKVSIDVGREDKVYSLLHRLRSTVREVSVSTVGTIERWFTSEVAASAEREKGNLPSKEDLNKATEAGGGGWHGLGWLGRGKWKVTRTNITKQGRCMSCGERLCTIDIDPEEREVFAKSVAKLACQRELKSNGFLAFQRWLEKHGPFEAIIDGANVGLYSAQTQPGFNFYQLNSVVRAVSARISNKRPLIVLHSRRTSNLEALTLETRLMVERWMEDKTLYSTPIGSNDDWYWLYAAVSCKCLIVTNDEMRDHLFQLLGDDFFPKWKERHQVRFTFSLNHLELHMPPPYSIVIQESGSGSWHIPQKGGDDIETLREWLCVTRAEAAAPIV